MLNRTTIIIETLMKFISRSIKKFNDKNDTFGFLYMCSVIYWSMGILSPLLTTKSTKQVMVIKK